MRTKRLVAGALIIGTAFLFGIWISTRLATPAREPVPVTASQTTLAKISDLPPATTSATAPHRQWSPEVREVREQLTEQAVKQFLTYLEENRAKLKTLHVISKTTSRGYDPKKQEWFDRGETCRGEAWISLEGAERDRVDAETAMMQANSRNMTLQRSQSLWD